MLATNYKLTFVPMSGKARKRHSKALLREIDSLVQRILDGNGPHFSPSGLTASLVMEKLQKRGFAFRIDWAPGIGYFLGDSTFDFKQAKRGT